MPGSKDVCGGCSAPFYGRQQFISCSGTCERRFHCKCVNIVEADYDLLMVNGISTYKCTSCTKRGTNNDEAGAARNGASSADGTTATVDSDMTDLAENREFDLQGLTPTLVKILQQMARKLDVLMAETKCLTSTNNAMRSEVVALRQQVAQHDALKSENSALRVQIAQLNGNLSLSGPLQRLQGGRQPAGSYATATSNSATLQKTVATTGPRTTALTATTGTQQTSVSKPTHYVESADGCAGLVNFGRDVGGSATDAVPYGAESGDGFTLVRPRRKTKPSVGTAKSSNVVSVPRPPREKALFVSRLLPNTSVTDIETLIEPLLEGKKLKCTKLKPRFPSYASFHLAMTPELFDALNQPDVWPEGCIFHEFFGRLDETRSFTHPHHA